MCLMRKYMKFSGNIRQEAAFLSRIILKTFVVIQFTEKENPTDCFHGFFDERMSRGVIPLFMSFQNQAMECCKTHRLRLWRHVSLANQNAH